MRYITDLHLHSRFSRACSNKINIPNLEKYAKIKGIDLMGTGDFQHPEWQKELKEHLEEDGTGILRTKSGFPFMLTSEISLIYKQGKKTRKIHNIVWCKSLAVAEKVSKELKKHGRIDYDGRPIFGMSCAEFVKLLKNIDEDIEIIPAHIWTPWFSLFGANSGFDSIKEAFQDTTKYINAVETGLSSDPEMNWRLSQLDEFTLVSFSDAHSFWPWRLGREATIFDLEKLTYKNIIRALKNKEAETIEVDPAYGKYHYDGHRNCNVSLPPKESIKNNNRCPRCGKQLTIGVDHRVEELADRPHDFKPKEPQKFRKLLPLSELISTVTGNNLATKTVWNMYYKFVNKERSEYDVLLRTPEEELEKINKKLAELIIRNRNQDINIIPGYDGVYGIPKIGNYDREIKSDDIVIKEKQKGLQDFF